MNGEIYDDMALEQNAKQLFGQSLEVDHVIARNIPVSPTTQATVFLTTKRLLMVYINGQSRLTLGDIKKLVSRMGLVAELYLPPKSKPHYFDDYGAARFKEVFPNRQHPTADDLIYYRTLAPYQPALVQILEVKHGAIYQYDRDARNSWRQAAKFTYRRIRTS